MTDKPTPEAATCEHEDSFEVGCKACLNECYSQLCNAERQQPDFSRLRARIAALEQERDGARAAFARCTSGRDDLFEKARRLSHDWQEAEADKKAAQALTQQLADALRLYGQRLIEAAEGELSPELLAQADHVQGGDAAQIGYGVAVIRWRSAQNEADAALALPGVPPPLEEK